MCFGGDSQSEASKEIDKKIKEESKKNVNRVNLLLLGAGESGKSTIAKQMRIIHLNGYSEEEAKSYREVVYSNILSCIKTLATAAEKFKYKTQNEEFAATIRELGTSDITPELWQIIITLWKDEAIQKAWARSSEFQLIDSASYFYENVDRISKETNYIPTVNDILHSRQMTTGIVEIDWQWKDVGFKMIDVGGQRNHRSKWIHCFERVTAIIFCVALSEYDQVLREDESQNRMIESLQLFESLVNSEWFYKTPFVIFFNKIDLFSKKIQKVDLNVCFPDYTGGLDERTAADFIKQKFLDKDECRSRTRRIYTYETCATDTKNIQTVFEVVRDIVTKQQLANVFG